MHRDEVRDWLKVLSKVSSRSVLTGWVMEKLRELTGVNPVPIDARDDDESGVLYWLSWGWHNELVQQPEGISMYYFFDHHPYRPRVCPDGVAA